MTSRTPHRRIAAAGRALLPCILGLAVLAGGFARCAAADDAPGGDHLAPIGVTIEPLPPPLNAHRDLAQRLVRSSPAIERKVTDTVSGKPLRAAVFAIHPAGPGDLTKASRACRNAICYRVDIYNYALNASFFAIVDVVRRRVVSVSPYLRGQPDLPEYLTQRALEIAVHSPEVEAALGFQPDQAEAVMPDVKTALNNTQCESSRHLCVAPTFVFERAERALWAIVDLTDERLVGIRWTDIGAVKHIRPTEQSIQRQDVYRNYCRHLNTVSRGGWRFSYIITSSDGLEIRDLFFRGEKVLNSAKLVDWHVSYSQRDGFGYSDAIGCPMFSSAAVGALEGPSLEALTHAGERGFALVQDFHHPQWPAPCNYRYQQRFEFYRDGRFRIAAGQFGRGCGVDGVYRPVLRIVPAVDPARFFEWDGAHWRRWKVEQWRLQDTHTAYTKHGYQYRILGNGRGWYLEPGAGQFPHNRGDHAYVYVTRDHPGEGDADLITIGPCCNQDYRQGPQQFIDDPPEPLDGAGIVIWYVAQLANDERPGHQYCWAETVVIDGLYQPKSWPCYAGPMFVPIHPAGTQPDLATQ